MGKNLKIVSWNVNSWRAFEKKPYFKELLEKHDPDIICMQETKLNKDIRIKVSGYVSVQHIGDRPGYSGTAILYRADPKVVKPPLNIRRNRTEGRLISMEFDDFVLVNVYVPNSGEALARLDYRVDEWDKKFVVALNKMHESKPLVVVGDMNVARTKNDIKHAKANEKSAGYTRRERDSFETILKGTNLRDVWRELHPDKVQYTYWSYRQRARRYNAGWRIDYVLASPSIKVRSCEILDDLEGSDHAPVIVELKS